MNKASKVILTGLTLFGTFVLGFQTGEWRAVERERRLHDWNGSIAQAQDATSRWAAKNHERPAMVRSTWHPQNTAFPEKNRIKLRLKGGVGGEPIYCYRSNTLELVEEYSDVE